VITTKLVGSVVSMIVGGVLAAVTIVGLVTHSVNSGSDNPGNVNAGVPYGTTQ
jgi:hypothetical protein